MEIFFDPVSGTCSMLEMTTEDGAGRFESSELILKEIEEYNRPRKYFTPYKVIMYNSLDGVGSRARMRILREAGFKRVLRYKGNEGIVNTMMKVMP